MQPTTEQKAINAKEFTSLLLSCELAVRFNKDKPNKAIKHTAKSFKARCRSPMIKQVCDNAIKSMYPIGWLNQQVQNIYRQSDYSFDEFISLGNSL